MALQTLDLSATDRAATKAVTSVDSTDGLVVTFAPTAEGAQTATLVLTSNDPSYPTLSIPLTGNADDGDNGDADGGDDLGGDGDVASKEVDGCGCDTTSGGMPAFAAVAALALLARRRRA